MECVHNTRQQLEKNNNVAAYMNTHHFSSVDSRLRCARKTTQICSTFGGAFAIPCYTSIWNCNGKMYPFLSLPHWNMLFHSASCLQAENVLLFFVLLSYWNILVVATTAVVVAVAAAVVAAVVVAFIAVNIECTYGYVYLFDWCSEIGSQMKSTCFISCNCRKLFNMHIHAGNCLT